MDMVNDGKDIRLDTPQAVKEALASGKDLYNPQTGEFCWEYNDTGSIANAAADEGGDTKGGDVSGDSEA